MIRSRASGLAAITLAAGVAAMSVTCNADPAATLRASDQPPLSAAQVSFVASMARLPHGRASVTWVGDLHTHAMQQWLTSRHAFVSMPQQEACARLVRLARSLLPEVKRASGQTGHAIDAAYEKAITESSVRGGCSGQAGPLSIWSNVGASLAMTQETDTVTWAFEEFIPQLENALSTATTPEQVAAAADGVLSQASSLPPADFQVLAAVASIETSSAWYWYQYGADSSQNAMSIFARKKDFSWLAFAGADLGGAITGFKVFKLFGAVNPHLLVVGAFGGAAVGSGLYAYHNAQ